MPTSPTRAGAYTLELSSRLVPLNANERLHWAAKSGRTRDWRQLACVTARQARVPSMARARIVVTVSFPDKRRRDVHNLYPTAKALVDGLIDAGVLPDDDDAHLIGPDMRRGPRCSGPVSWRIDIEEMTESQ